MQDAPASPPPEPLAGAVPVTLLTGFLGAGKTTLLNRILGERHGERIAVIENEFGPEGVDGEILVRGDEQLVAMNNGCLCCTVRGDLIRILGDLAHRRERGEIGFDRVVIETTGLADPGPVAQTFFVDESVAAAYRLDAVLTVVDALHAPEQLDAFEEAQEQVGFADRILLSKTDLVAQPRVDALVRRLRGINARAPILRADFGRAPLAQLLDVRGFDLEAVLALEPGFLGEDQHTHDDAIASHALRCVPPLDADALDRFLRRMIEAHGPDLLRYKGILHVSGQARRVVLQGVHMSAGWDLGRAWSDDEARESVLVLIGRGLPLAPLQAQFAGCASDGAGA